MRVHIRTNRVILVYCTNGNCETDIELKEKVVLLTDADQDHSTLISCAQDMPYMHLRSIHHIVNDDIVATILTKLAGST